MLRLLSILIGAALVTAGCSSATAAPGWTYPPVSGGQGSAPPAAPRSPAQRCSARFAFNLDYVNLVPPLTCTLAMSLLTTSSKDSLLGLRGGVPGGWRTGRRAVIYRLARAAADIGGS